MNRFFAFVGAWFIAFILYVSLATINIVFAIISPLLLILPMWFILDKKVKGTEIDMFFKRIKNFKNYKGRMWTSIIMFIFFGGISIGMVAEKINKGIEDSVVPEITLLSSSGYLGSVSGYALSINVSGAKTIEINGRTYNTRFTGYTYNELLPLDNQTLQVNITATNAENNKKLTFNVSRDKTSGEIDAEKKAEADRILQEKKVEADRIAKEKYMKSPEYKAELKRIALEDVVKTKEFTMTSMCKEAVTSLLKSPSSADFPFMGFEFYISRGQIIAKSYVDSQNGFGAMIRTDFSCYFEANGGEVSIVDIKF